MIKSVNEASEVRCPDKRSDGTFDHALNFVLCSKFVSNAQDRLVCSERIFLFFFFEELLSLALSKEEIVVSAFPAVS